MRALAPLLLALLLAGGCGGDGGEETAPSLPQAVAQELAQRSDAVAAKLDAGDHCAARTEAEGLQQQTIAAVNDGRVPARYQEELTAAVGALVASIECVPTSTPPLPPPEEDEDDDEDEDEVREDEDGEREDDDDEDEGEGEGKGKGEGNGKGKDGKGGRG